MLVALVKVGRTRPHLLGAAMQQVIWSTRREVAVIGQGTW
jgi:hypothetical protein